VLAITLLRWLTFHDFVPNTYWAKSGGTARHVQLGMSYLAELFERDFPFIVFAPLALLSRAGRSAKRYILLVSGVWIVFFVRTGGDVFGFSRLAFPLIPVLTVLAARGLVDAAERVLARARLSAVVATAGALLSLVLIAGGVLVHQYGRRLAPVHGDPKVLAWRALGLYLRANYPHTTIATVPIGAIAYYSEQRVIDMLGLTTPAVAKAARALPAELLERRWIGHERHNLDWILAQEPTLVVTTKVRSTPWQHLDEAGPAFTRVAFRARRERRPRALSLARCGPRAGRSFLDVRAGRVAPD
jgi:hypothetical protein